MFLSAGEIAAYMHLARQLGRQEAGRFLALDQAVTLSIATFPTRPVRLEQFLDKLLEDTRTELKTRWSHVETLAAALLRRGELSAEEIMQILENTPANHP